VPLQSPPPPPAVIAVGQSSQSTNLLALLVLIVIVVPIVAAIIYLIPTTRAAGEHIKGTTRYSAAYASGSATAQQPGGEPAHSWPMPASSQQGMIVASVPATSAAMHDATV
jgi:hypothetical protein